MIAKIPITLPIAAKRDRLIEGRLLEPVVINRDSVADRLIPQAKATCHSRKPPQRALDIESKSRYGAILNYTACDRKLIEKIHASVGAVEPKK
jgi:hypothetical protein